MAWYALYKWFISFRKSTYVNYITLYKKYLYDQWFNGLSQEDQQAEIRRIEKEKEARRRRTQQALSILYGMSLCVNGRDYDPW